MFVIVGSKCENRVKKERGSPQRNAFIPLPNGFNLENFASLGNRIKVLVNCLQKDKDLCRFPSRAPCRETSNVSEEDCAVWKKVSNGLITGLRYLFVSIQERG